ncbi:MAG: ribose-phosphate diphosphokinase [Thermoprotei archaeon]|nr:MAG: ribose-phosphate diphosphokinase [Thermoprotei archaeon]
MIVLGVTATNGIDQELAAILGARHVVVEHKLFPDGESYIRIPVDVSGEDVIVVQSTYKPQDKHLIELLIAIDALRDLGARRITVVIPYLAYARQDKRFREGEGISIKTILQTIRANGADDLIVVEIHKEESLKFFRGRAINIPSVYALAEYFKNMSNLLILAPDKGALKRAKIFAELVNGECDYLEKFRDRVTGEISVKPKSIDVKGKNVVIVDDIVSTGKTMALAARKALENGALNVYAACAHALLINNALDLLKNSGIKEIIATNTVPVPKEVKTVSIAPYIAKAIKELYETR